MQLFRKLLGPDTDSSRLFEAAMGTARDRVVVKRPAGAEPLGGSPTASFGGKVARFDMYLIKRN
jgi:16S rRNA (guanine1516-N2)-methyltransferase